MHLGIVGYGNIASSLIGLLDRTRVTRVTVLVRPDRLGRTQREISATKPHVPIDVASSRQDFLAAGPDLVAECAGHGAVAEHGAAILDAGLELIVASVGALAAPDLQRDLNACSARTGARIIIPIGAIGGLDLLAMLAQAGAVSVKYRGTKPPAAWKGTSAEAALDLDNLREPARFFTGTARQVAQAYPKNANVVATLALFGAGFDDTRVELVADPHASGNRHAYEVASPICSYRMEIAATPSPEMPRTSATTAWSVLAEIQKARSDLSAPAAPLYSGRTDDPKA